MAVKYYTLRFGVDNPANKTGLSPTFVKFLAANGGATTAPSIFEINTGVGVYIFSYECTGFISFVVDGGASLTTNERYVSGVLDINDRNNETLAGIGSTLFAVGSTLSSVATRVVGLGNSLTLTNEYAVNIFARLGTISDSHGNSSVEPTTVFGYLKRIQELHEGNSQFVKATGIWNIYSRGSSHLLRAKTITESQDEVNKT